MSVHCIDSLIIDELLAGYRHARFTPADVVDCVLERADRAHDHGVWIARLSRAAILEYTDALAGRAVDELPLFGIPFAIKDNIDLEGAPTTAACPAFSYQPARSAAVVQRLIDAGAVPLGKTNLDQFATGLVGTRSPYGACRNGFDPRYISGGSSSGSAVAVALGVASFALGTDTAGSGRVPAAFNNLIGVKPSFGRLSCRGVVPACRTLDCVSIFALTAEDGARVLEVAEGFDALDAYSRPAENAALAGARVGIPRRAQLEFFGDAEYAALFDRAVERVRSLGFPVVEEIDVAPFLETAQLLYQGPWVAERYAALEAFMHSHADALYPVTRQIIASAGALSAADAFRGQYQLMALKRRSEAVWRGCDVVLLPTAGTIFKISEIEADPIALNTKLGLYTNFVNLLDLAAVAIPAGFRGDGLPFGVTVVGGRSTDRALLQLASTLHRGFVKSVGARNVPLPPASQHGAGAVKGVGLGASASGDEDAGASVNAGDLLAVAVCGAHMEGLPLNHQLRERGASLKRKARTAACYRLYALPGASPERPGLIRIPQGGASIDVEVWAMPASQFGSFVGGIGAPLGIGKIELDDGEIVSGFLCESYAVENAADITAFRSWREYLRR